MSRWELELPDGDYVSPNKRVHWTARSRLNRVWRHAAKNLAKEARIPRLQHARVELHFWPGDRRRRDPDNLVSGVMKPCVDGLVDAGVLADDTAVQVERVFPVIHVPTDGDRRRRWVLIVTDLSKEPAR